MSAVSPLEGLERYKVILASGSPRRRELLGMLGVEFECKPLQGVDETYPATMDAMDVAPYLARKKCGYACGLISGDELVITADTVVVCGGKVLGKPTDADDARRMLHTLSGRTHAVVTGLAVATSGDMQCASAVTEVTFAELTDQEIDYYVEHYSPLDKAGAYGIQEWIGEVGVKGINGSYYNVMGLPMHVLYTLLRYYCK